ncbi:MAG: UDP-N-acetylmuramate--L-alanine ligase [Gammaproteobacteria bacterium]|nr:UDP-N-acetylmuramate--L-alanine ligase [Gammaproteobacteria bacterium]MCY4342030.1 UDP-N-acetylmuramate--L-alanine ligase [Gammaproteobacteria bacterium]
MGGGERQPLAVAAVPEMGQVRRVHFVGIGGAGMSGIAEVMRNLGYAVSGSDLCPSPATERLAALGATVHEGHAAEQVADADVVVRSSAVADSNPEIASAHERRIPVVARAEMLGELMRYRHGIAIAGTHGKTTTTSLLTAIYQAAGLDPTFVIGGLLESAGANARLGASRFIIVEADESDASFLHLQPMLAVVTNIDEDHMATYGHDFERLCATFLEFIHRLPFYGTVVLCIDDPVLRGLLPKVSRPMLTYGLAPDADYRADALAANGRCWRFQAHRPGQREPLDISLAAPGEHNVRNALAAIAVATHEGVADAAIRQGLAGFAGVGRRFQVFEDIEIGSAKVTLVDDYGHHPTEIEAVVRTARKVWPGRRFVMAYQPHRYSRTRDLFDRFVRVLSSVDQLILLSVYAAGEPPIPGADGHALCQGIRSRGAVAPVFAVDPDEALALLPGIVRSGDVVLVQGAGNVSEVSNRLRDGRAE